MNKTVIFLFIAIVLLIFSIICVSVAPIMNDILGKFTRWGKFNCKYYADQAKYSDSLDEKFKQEKLRNLCYRQNAMYGLEYSSFIIDLSLGFICAQGLIGGGIGFILTLVYVCFSGYIFNNDAAFKNPELDYSNLINKLYSNGALYKIDSSSSIYPYSNDKSYDSQYIKYKDLGDKQYNYDKKFYETFYGLKLNPVSRTNCREDASIGSSCKYVYAKPPTNNENKYLYDRWCLSLVLAVFITISNIGLLIFGFFIFKGNGDSSDIQEVKIE